MNLIDIQSYFCKLHDITCNQKYNETLSYSFHLEMVATQAHKFKHLMPIDSSYNEAVWIGIWGHDSIEDARITYNGIKQSFGQEAAEIIYLCTENKGRDRGERKNDVWYHQIKKNDLAVFVKLCDIIANSLFSVLSNSTMFNKYKTEYNQKVKPLLYVQKYKEMFDYLDKIYNL